jgi:hypothetical protein
MRLLQQKMDNVLNILNLDLQVLVLLEIWQDYRDESEKKSKGLEIQKYSLLEKVN